MSVARDAPARGARTTPRGRRAGARRAADPFAAATRPSAPRLALAVLLGAGAAACAVGLIATSGWLISRSAQRPTESAVAVAIVGVQFFALGRGLLRYCERLAGHDAALRVLARLRVRIYERLERLAPAGLPAFRSGDLLARIVDDVDSIQDLLLRVGPPFAIAAAVGTGTALVAFAMLPAAGLIVLALVALSMTAVPWAARGLARRSAARRAGLRGELSAEIVEVLAGAGELTVNGGIDGALARVAEADRRLGSLAHAEARTAGIGQGLARGLSGLAMWGSLTVGVAAVADGRLDPVLLAGLALIPLVLFEILAPLPAAAQTLQGVRRSRERLQDVIEAPLPVGEPAPAASLEPAARRGVAVRGLRCRYPGQERWALAGVDLDLAPGARVAVVGPSGAGKTTLAWVLLRFLAYESGSVTIDGVEVANLGEAAVRGAVGLVEQDPHVFSGTLAANLRLARPDASDEELLEALARVRLDEWTGSLPDGLETEMGEHGSRISGGQRQRLGLARALLADFPVLILDEPGEHVEPAAARAILTDLLEAARGRSVLMITHELVGLDDFDEIVVLDTGRSLERGAHGRLLAAGGMYASLWQQAGGSTSGPGS
jgi:ATP-binding cassette subfamily C protein CydC